MRTVTQGTAGGGNCMGMADPRHLALLRRGVGEWNAWRRAKPTVQPDLRGADLTEADLRGANLSGSNLSWANLSLADLSGADLRGAGLYDANLGAATLSRARLTEADLSRAYLREANLTGADLRGATLLGADLWAAQLSGAALAEADLSLAHLDRAHLFGAHLERAQLHDADLTEANLSQANLSGADLSRADLTCAILTGTALNGATLDGCRVYGISAWNVELEDAIQTNLRITPDHESEITVDKLEVAQFLYLMLHNEEVRDLIESITSKVILVLGHFTDERKAVRETLRETLRRHEPPYVPVVVDIEEAGERNTPQMVTTLARLAHFIIADMSDPVSIRPALQAILPHIQTPVLPIVAESTLLSASNPSNPSNPSNLPSAEYGESPSMRDLYRYPSLQGLAATVREVIAAPIPVQSDSQIRIQELPTQKLAAQTIPPELLAAFEETVTGDAYGKATASDETTVVGDGALAEGA